jgi:hypothetical protein
MTDRGEEEESLPSLQEEEEEPDRLHLNVFWQGERDSDSDSESEEEEEKDSDSESEEEEEEKMADDDNLDYLSQKLGVALRATDRTTQEVKKKKPLVEAKDRESMKPKEKSQLHEIATAGIKTKFEIMDSIILNDGEAVATLSKAYRVDLRIAEVRAVAERYDMDDVFQIPSEFVAHPDFSVPIPTARSEMVNLFTGYYKLDMDTIKKACDFYAVRGADWQVENLQWTGELILNCCSPDLRTRIETQAQSVPYGKEAAYQSGPVYFKMMMDYVIVRDSSAIRGLISQFESITVKNFPGENVRDYNTVAVGVYNMLANSMNLSANAAIPDMAKLVKRGLIASSTPEFNSDLTAHSVLLGRDCTVEALTDKANELYSGLLGASLWVAGDGKQSDSGFFAGNCYECGEKGHKSVNCPKKKKDGDGNNNSGNRGSGNGRGNGRGGRGGRGGGRGGRGGRGGGRGGGDSNGSNDKKEKDPFSTPPKKGESHTKTINGKTYHWCGRCNRWVDHDTDQHRAMLALKASEPSDTKSSDKSDDKKESGNFAGRLTPRF